MALISCLYCGEKIYEHVSVCPKCNASKPFDANKKASDKANYEASLKLKQLKNNVESGSIACVQCGSKVSIADILKGRVICRNCGFDGNFIKCKMCSGNAILYDPQQQQFTCRSHYVEPCLHCHKLIQGTEKYFNQHNVAFCHSCYKKLVRNEFISRHPDLILGAKIVGLLWLLGIIFTIIKACS